MAVSKTTINGKAALKVSAKRGKPSEKTAGNGASGVSARKAKPAKGKSAGEREVLAEELRGLIPRLDAEGLSFLIEQAQVHLYNMQVEELNQTLARSSPKTGPKTGPKRVSPDMRIEGAESGSSYYLVYNGDWIMFSREEMVHITRIVSAPGTDPEIRERLFNWFLRERRDVLSSVPMADKSDEKLKKLIALVKKTFKVRYR
jgi:hypothetical protein